MPGFLIRLLIGALGLWLAARLLPGMHIDGAWTLAAASLLLGVANAVLRPVLVLLTFPITVLTLGLFLLVINAAMLGLVAALLERFSLDGFPTAFLGALIVSVVGWFGSWYVGPSGRVEIVVQRRRR